MAEPWKNAKIVDVPELKNVLIVDDNDRYAAALTDQLKEAGAVVTRAYNAAEGVDKLQENNSFDGVITDISMESQISGLKVMRAARKKGKKFILAVATTGLDITIGYLFNRFFLGIIMGANYIIPKRPIKREKKILWIKC